jgi:hypothetical protein
MLPLSPSYPECPIGEEQEKFYGCDCPLQCFPQPSGILIGDDLVLRGQVTTFPPSTLVLDELV